MYHYNIASVYSLVPIAAIEMLSENRRNHQVFGIHCELEPYSKPYKHSLHTHTIGSGSGDSNQPVMREARAQSRGISKESDVSEINAS